MFFYSVFRIFFDAFGAVPTLFPPFQRRFFEYSGWFLTCFQRYRDFGAFCAMLFDFDAFSFDFSIFEISFPIEKRSGLQSVKTSVPSLTVREVVVWSVEVGRCVCVGWVYAGWQSTSASGTGGVFTRPWFPQKFFHTLALDQWIEGCGSKVVNLVRETSPTCIEVHQQPNGSVHGLGKAHLDQIFPFVPALFGR